MKLERAKNSIRNVKFGIINKVLMILFPFFVRTVFIKTLGVKYLGLNSLFSSILMILNLTELGFSSAVVFCMYEPIAKKDYASVNALLFFYKKVYFYIGIIITFVGCLIIPFLDKLISGGYPQDINIVIVYLVYLFNTVISYFFYGYKSSLISAYQREDVISKINLLMMSIMYIIQIIFLLICKNYYLYIIIMPVFTILNNFRISIIVNKMFPMHKPVGKLSKKYRTEIKEKIKGLIIFKLCYVSRNAFDSIFISYFLGLVDIAIYNNYYYILNAIVGITTVFTSSVLSGVGNSVVLETEEKNYKDMLKMNFIYMWLCGWFTVCLLCLYQPFMKIWVGSELMYPMSCVILFCLYFYVLKLGDVRYIYEQAKGLWWEYRFRSILEAVCNIILNYFLGKYFGIIGIIVATICTIFFINYIYGTRIIFKQYFIHESEYTFLFQNLCYTVCTILVCIVTYFICYKFIFIKNSIFFQMLICTIVPNFMYFIFYKKTKIYKISITWLFNKLNLRRIGELKIWKK